MIFTSARFGLITASYGLKISMSYWRIGVLECWSIGYRETVIPISYPITPTLHHSSTPIFLGGEPHLSRIQCAILRFVSRNLQRLGDLFNAFELVRDHRIDVDSFLGDQARGENHLLRCRELRREHVRDPFGSKIIEVE